MSTILWVAQGAADGGTGSVDTPFNSIQAAIDASEPGTTIMVGAGTYVENLDFSFGGTEDAPITLVSADGPQAAVIKPADPGDDTIQIDGHDHITIDGFELHGSADDSRQVIHIHAVDGNTNPASNIAILNNVIYKGAGDGIKVSKSEDIFIDGNTILGGSDKESAIDLVGVVGAIMSNNLIQDIGGIGIMIKGGSSDIAVIDNTLDTIGRNAIEVGGYSNLGAYPPGFLDGGNTYEATNVLVSGNTINDSGNWALRLIGAQGVAVLDNVISGDGARMRIDDSDKFHDPWFSDDIGFFGNTIETEDWLRDRSESAEITFAENAGSLFDWWPDAFTGNGASVEPTAQAEPEPDPAPEPEPEPAPEPQPVAEPETAPEPAPEPEADLPTEDMPVPDSGDVVPGTDREDRLEGTSAAEAIDGAAGDDRIDGRGGDDTLLGGGGDDEIDGGAGHDLLLGEAGDDRLKGDDGRDTLFGGDGKDELEGEGGDDLLFGEAGDDRLRGNDGDDILSGGEGADRVEGDAGADELHGDAGADELRGGDGGDLLFGGTGNDELRGDDGDDTLNGGSGDDVLEGGNGSDHFVFSFDAGIGADEIKDFDETEDVLVFQGFGDVLSDFSDLDTNGDGVLSELDTGISRNGSDLSIDISHAFGAGAGSHVLSFEAEDATSDLFVFL